MSFDSLCYLGPPREHGFRNSELEIRKQIVGKSILICLKNYFLLHVLIILVFLHLCMIAASAAS